MTSPWSPSCSTSFSRIACAIRGPPDGAKSAAPPAPTGRFAPCGKEEGQGQCLARPCPDDTARRRFAASSVGDVGEEAELAGPLDRRRELRLVAPAGAGDPR